MPHPKLRILPDTVRLAELPSELPEGNVDRFGRTIDYLRISITDRCNLRCTYCMPEAGVQLSPKEALLTFEEIWRVAAAARRSGFRKFRVTGGEPLVVKGVLTFLAGLTKAVDGATVCLTTNAVYLESQVHELRKAGVSRLNISLDTVDRRRFQRLTRRDALDRVLAGLEAAMGAGFERVKVNAVIVPGVNEDDLIPMVRLAKCHDLDVRFIEQMPLDGEPDGGFLGADEILRRIGQTFPLESSQLEDRRDAAQRMFRSPSLRGRVGVIAPRSTKFCSSCNRMRLTPEGELKGCLLSEGTLDIRTALREGASDGDIERLLAYAIGIKPEEYRDEGYGLDRSMSAIGG